MKFFRIFLFSMPLALILMVIFGVAIAWATFIENDFGTAVAQSVIFKTTWFEALLAMMMINMIGVIVRYKMYQKSKWSALLLHSAFIVIIIGAAITRYYGYEGAMQIREGESSNKILSNQVYVRANLEEGANKEAYEKAVQFTKLSRVNFSKSFDFSDQEITMKMTKFLSNAGEVMVDDEQHGKPILALVVSEGGRADYYLEQGGIQKLSKTAITFNNQISADHIQIISRNDSLMIKSPIQMVAMSMATSEQDTLLENIFTPFKQRHLYTIGGVNVVLRDFVQKGRMQWVSRADDATPKSADAIVMEVSNGKETKEVTLVGAQGYPESIEKITIGNTEMAMSYGSKYIELPFSIELKDFDLERYPGSESPASFASEVVLRDERAGVEMPYRIFMNNILDYDGYRFFQSSYSPDEKGTVLSVNHDFWGTMVTYIGYFLLFAALLMVTFVKNTRFRHLSKMIDDIHEKRKSGIAVALILMFAVSSQAFAADTDPPTPVDKEHAAKFGMLVTQNRGGRLMPVNTFADQILKKVLKKSSFDGLDANQIFLGMISEPQYWQNAKLIKIGSFEAIQKILGVEGEYASYLDFFDESGQYKLKKNIEEAYAKSPAKRTKLEKEGYMKIDERVNICYMTFHGQFLNFFPIPKDATNKWVSPVNSLGKFSKEDSLFVAGVIPFYFDYLRKANVSGDYEEADKVVDAISKFQHKYGSDVMPSAKRVEFEMMYNKVNIFVKLILYHMLFGFILLILVFMEILLPKLKLTLPIKIISGLIFLGFLLHTAGLVIRWYISGHEPWSDSYESMIYIAWATLLAGLVFYKKSSMTVAATALFTGLILGVAFLTSMDPTITNLVPVLNSYWLTVHTAIIVAGYGPFGLGALLGFFNLVLMIFKNKKNRERINLSIMESTYIMEMALIVGLVLFTIGNFLGGIWANESWGRYWGWDPKETWAMVTIVVYSIIIHFRFIPKLSGVFALNLATLIAYASPLMTYFGVNYYLSGLHSYAAGDPAPIPNSVYYAMATIAFVGVLAYINQNKYENKAT